MHEGLTKVLEEARSAWRFRWRALCVAWAVAVVGWIVVLVVPDQFQATARVFVDPTTSLQPVIQGLAVEQDVNAELNLVRQSLLSEPQLRRVVSQAGLDAKAVTDADRARIVAALRESIEIVVQGTGSSDRGQPLPGKVYAINYRAANRAKSLEVVQIMLDTFVEGTLGGKREGSQQAQVFLQNQIKEYEKRLAVAEQSLADFKKQNVGLVPGEQQGDYFTRLQTEMDAVTQAQNAITTVTSRRDALRRQLRGEAPIAASTGTVAGPGGTTAAAGDTLTRIKDTQTRLEELLLRFTDRHPDVIALEQNLEQLKARREAEIAALKTGDPNAAALTGASANPVYQSIQLQLNQAEIEYATLRTDLNTRQQKVAALRRMLDTMPQVEAEYSRLTRDYDVTKAQYTALAERLEKARVGEGADETGSVRFEIIDPPAAPFDPISPPRVLLLLVVLLLALAAGGATAYASSMMRPVFGSVASLEAATGIKVLGAISFNHAPDALVAMKRGNVAYAGLMGGLLVVFGVVWVIGSKFAPLSAESFGF